MQDGRRLTDAYECLAVLELTSKMAQEAVARCGVRRAVAACGAKKTLVGVSAEHNRGSEGAAR